MHFLNQMGLGDGGFLRVRMLQEVIHALENWRARTIVFRDVKKNANVNKTKGIS